MITAAIEAPTLAHSDRLFIDGRWVAPADKRAPLKVVSPINARVFAEVAAPSAKDVGLAVDAARRAFDSGPWPRMPPAQRAEALRAVATALTRRGAAAARAWTTQIGMPLWLSELISPAAIGILNINADIAEGYRFEEVRPTQATGMSVAVIVKEPVGVVAAIAPWNAPLIAILHKVAPALAAGCTVVAKPAPESPIEAYLLAEAVEEAGLPPGVFNLLCADREVSDLLIHHPQVDKVSFTGSTAVGKHIAEVCSHRMARVTMELGGKSAALVCQDMPPEQVAAALAPAITLLCGQVCANLTRILVPKRLEQQYTEALAAAMAETAVGDPLQPKIMMGPLAMSRQLKRVECYVARGLAQGARLATGGGRLGELGDGYFFEPTVFAQVTNDMVIAREEIFGPVACVIPYADEEEAIRIANDSPYGLSGAVFTRDTDRAYAIARRLRSGNLSQNGHGLDIAVPFGGFKQSGYGREGGPEGLEAYLELKAIFLPRPPSHLV